MAYVPTEDWDVAEVVMVRPVTTDAASHPVNPSYDTLNYGLAPPYNRDLSWAVMVSGRGTIDSVPS